MVLALHSLARRSSTKESRQASSRVVIAFSVRKFMGGLLVGRHCTADLLRRYQFRTGSVLSLPHFSVRPYGRWLKLVLESNRECLRPQLPRLQLGRRTANLEPRLRHSCA